MSEGTGIQPKLYALLIGVDNYLKHTLPGGGYYPKLGGCVADVRRVEAFLKTNLDLPEENIYKLTATYGLSPEPPEPKDQWPTYENMVAAFQKVTEVAGEGDQVYVHYSGHGGRTKTIYPDLKGESAHDESLVPMDIGREDARYLRDLELAHIFQSMVDKGIILTVVLDSCHSGGTTRALDVAVRGIAGIDITPRPTDSLVASAEELAAVWQGNTGGQTRALKPGGGWLPQPEGYTLLAACRSQEFAHEYNVAPGKRGGALTWWTLESLKQLGPGLTYRMLHNQVLPKIHSKFPQQTPQLQGMENRTVFGSETVQPLPSVNVVEVGQEGKRVQLATGQVQAVTKGAQFAVYPEGTEDFRQVERRLALVEIDDLGAASSWAKLVKGFGRGEMAQGDQAVLLDPGKVRLRRRVRLVTQGPDQVPPEIDQVAALEAIRSALEKEGSGWVSLGQEGETVDYQVAVSDMGFYEIWDRAGMPVPNLRPALYYRDTSSPARVVQRLVHLTKFNNLLLLDNHDPTSPLARALEVDVLQAQPDYEPGEPPEPVPFDDPGNTPVAASDQWLLARVQNRSPETLNIAVFDLSSDWSVAQVHPTWTDYISLDAGAEEIFPLQAGLPAGCEDGIDVLKVFATLGPASFRWLEMPELDQPPMRGSAATRSVRERSPLEEMLAAFIDDKPLPLTRSLNPAEYPSRGWATAQVEVHVKKNEQGLTPEVAPQVGTVPAVVAVPEQPLSEIKLESVGGEPMEPDAQNPERKSPWTPEVIIQAFKEVITALLGLAVVGYTLILAGNALSLVGQPEKLSDAKDILMLVLGLAGVVVGYYFGRVPADARASQAQEQANDATAQAEQVNAQAQAIADEVDEVMERMARPSVTARGAESSVADPALAEDLHRIRDDLRSLSRMSRRR